MWEHLFVIVTPARRNNEGAVAMQCCEDHLNSLATSELASLTPQLEPWFFPEDHPPAGEERDLVNQRLVDLARLQEHAALHLARAAHVAAVSRSFRIDGARSVAAWLATSMSMARSDAHRAVRRGHAIDAYPLLESAWKNHRLTGAHVDRFARLIDDNPDVENLLDRDASLLIDTASDLTPEEFQKLCNRWRDLADPDAAYARWCRRHERRHLSMAHDLEGSLLFQGRIDGADGEVFFQAIAKRENELFLADWAAAKDELGRTPTVSELSRTSAQRRLDALADLVRRGSGVTVDGEPESKADITIDYVLDHYTAQEALDRVFGTVGDGGPVDRLASPTSIPRSPGVDTAAAFDPMRFCETFDGRSIPPEVIIRDAFRARIRRVVFEGPSVVVDAGRSRRLFDGPQRNLVKLRDRRCRHPFCNVVHWRCEIDHVDAHVDGGATDPGNAALLCDVHHDEKSRGQTVVRAGPKGRLEWFRSDGHWLGSS